MNKEKLVTCLESLRSEVSKLTTDDTLALQHVNRMISDIEHQILNSTVTEHPTTMLKNLQALVEQFEGEHPRMTGVLNEMMLILSNMGI